MAMQGDIFSSEIQNCVYDSTLTTTLTLVRTELNAAGGGRFDSILGSGTKAWRGILSFLSAVSILVALYSAVLAFKKGSLYTSLICVFLVYACGTAIVRQIQQPLTFFNLP